MTVEQLMKLDPALKVLFGNLTSKLENLSKEDLALLVTAGLLVSAKFKSKRADKILNRMHQDFPELMERVDEVLVGTKL